MFFSRIGIDNLKLIYIIKLNLEMKFLNLFSPLNSCKDLRFHLNFGDNNNERRFLYIKDCHSIG